MMHTRRGECRNPVVWMKNPEATLKEAEAARAVYEFAGLRLDSGRRVLERAQAIPYPSIRAHSMH